MITCPACGHKNIDGTQFCEMCGEELPDSATPVTSGATDVKCPNCGHLNPADNLACEACGTNLQASVSSLPGITSTVEITPFDNFPPPVQTTPDPVASPTPFVPSLAGVSDPSASAIGATPTSTPQTPGDLQPGLVKLVVEQGQTVGAQFVLGDNVLEVGREDEEEDIYPDIDLSDQDAGYVHRRHATLNFDNGRLTVTHLGGANKTRVNNKPVADNVPTEIKLGDKVAFGKVVLRLLPA